MARYLDYIVVGILFILIVGRVFWFPIALFVVSGNSMLPVYRTGDIVLGVAVYLSGYSVGDVVVWYATFTHGVIHRVYNVTDGYVVTKGDNNPLPDPPVPKGFVKYRVVALVPRELWISVAVALTVFYLYRRRRDIIYMLRYSEAGGLGIATAVFAVFIVIDIVTLFAIAIQWFSYRTVLVTPSVELRRIDVVNGSIAYIDYNIDNAIPIGITSCFVNISSYVYRCPYSYISGHTAVVSIPREIYRDAYRVSNSTIARISLALNISFDKGWVYGVYSYVVNWRPLDIYVENRSLAIYNPNYIPFNITDMKIVYMDIDSFGRPYILDTIYIGNKSIEPLTKIVIEPVEKGRYCYIQFTYSYKFSDKGYVYESRRIDFG